MPKAENVREDKQIKLFGLAESYVNAQGKVCKFGRGNGYKPDARFADLVLPDLGFDWFTELKTWRNDKRSVSSSRDTHLKKIADWKSVPFWIFSKYDKNDPRRLLDTHYAMTADDMDPFVTGLALRKILEGGTKQIGLNAYNEKIRPAILADENAAPLIEIMDMTMKQHGTKQNDQKISLLLLEQYGKLVTSQEEVVEYFTNWIEDNDEADLASRFAHPSWVR
jgi:hypothetical protein